MIRSRFARVATAFLLILLATADADESSSADKLLSVSIFAKLPFFQELKLSPDGTRMAFIAPIKGRKHLLSKSLVEPDAKYHVLPPGDKSDIAWFRWANNERLLVAYSGTVRRLGTDYEETRLLSTDFAMTGRTSTVN